MLGTTRKALGVLESNGVQFFTGGEGGVWGYRIGIKL